MTGKQATLVRCETRGRVQLWTIERADVRNALSMATVLELEALANAARLQRQTVRAVVITGAGELAFSAGADLKERRGFSEDQVRDWMDLIKRTLRAIDRLPMPVIAAMNGSAFGGGLELALACDMRVLNKQAQVGLTEVGLAIIPGGGGTQRLTKLIGPARAKDMIIGARRITAEHALAWGIVDRLAAGADAARERALELAGEFAEQAPIAVAAALDAIDAATQTDLDSGLAIEHLCYERTLKTEDRIEALNAFAEKRKPVFRGR